MNTKKTIVTCLLALFVIAIALFGVGVMNGKVEAQSGTDVFEMVDLYKLRLNGNGFAFTVKMNGIVKQTVNDNLYFLIAPKTLFDDCDKDGVGYERLVAGGGEDVLYTKVNNIYKKTDGGVFWYANGGLNNISEEIRTTKYRAVAVIETKTNDRLFYRFASGFAVNDLYNVVAGGFYGGKNQTDIISAYGGWFGTSKYPIPVDNQSEYNTLKFIAATEEGASFVTGKKIEIDESVDKSDNALIQYTSNIITTYTVTWMDHNGRLLEKDTHVKYSETPCYDGISPERDGYTFIGWDKDISPVTKNVDYIAVYTKNENNPSDIYILTVVNGTGGGTYSSGVTVTITCDDDIDTETYIKTFVGWKKSGSEVIISTSRTIQVYVTEDVTYTAVFETEYWTELLH